MPIPLLPYFPLFLDSFPLLKEEKITPNFILLPLLLFNCGSPSVRTSILLNQKNKYLSYRIGFLNLILKLDFMFDVQIQGTFLDSDSRAQRKRGRGAAVAKCLS